MVLNGLGVSPGVGIGRALVVTRGTRDLRFRVPERRVASELARLDDARARARAQLQRIKERIEQAAGAGHAYMFDAQLLMLDDPMLVERAAAIIRDERLNAASALRRALDEISSVFDGVEDSYLRERKGDVEDVVGRLCMNLRSTVEPSDLFKDLEGPLVLVADELSPSIVAQLDWQRLAALVTDAGSWTYHTAILARSLHVPAVAGLRHASATIAPGALVAVDGGSGDVLVDPPEDTLTELEARSRKRRAYERSLAEYRDLPSVTLDGTPIRIEANVEIPEEAARAKERGAEGIGLYRSEFLLAGTTVASLDEDAQYSVYRRLLEEMDGSRVTVRTFDVSESQLGVPGHAEGSRAPLGLRGLRLSLSFDALFQAQLRALLRAAAQGPLRIMFPFVTGIEELRAAKAAVAHAAEALRAKGMSVPDVPIGIMIEVPSAALTVDLLAEEADFFSIGTNDLIQYCLAVDRTDDRVSRLYEPLHPAILRVLRHVARGARRRGLPVSVCGEMAADPVMLPLLAGLGLREFSMTPAAIPMAKQVVRGLRISETARLASRALKAATAADVEHTLAEFLSPART